MPAGRRPSGGPVRHNNPTFRFTEYPNVPYAGDVPVDPEPTWPLDTLEWWAAIIRMPHCAGWGETDWQYAKDTGRAHARWIETRDNRWLPELRQREAKMGTTADARLTIRVRYLDPTDDTEATGTVTPIRKVGS